MCQTCRARPECAAEAVALIDNNIRAVGVWAGVVLQVGKPGRGRAIAALRPSRAKPQVRNRHLPDVPRTPVLLCWRHHHDFAHQPAWHLKLLPDATVEVTKPDGRVLTSRPPPLGTLAEVGGLLQDV